MNFAWGQKIFLLQISLEFKVVLQIYHVDQQKAGLKLKATSVRAVTFVPMKFTGISLMWPYLNWSGTCVCTWSSLTKHYHDNTIFVKMPTVAITRNHRGWNFFLFCFLLSSFLLFWTVMDKTSICNCSAYSILTQSNLSFKGLYGNKIIFNIQMLAWQFIVKHVSFQHIII